jgi:hypothetical protein
MFKLEIQLGNAAMRSSEDVAAALRAVSEKVDAGDTAGIVRDANGNTVGRWTLQNGRRDELQDRADAIAAGDRAEEINQAASRSIVTQFGVVRVDEDAE